MTTLLDQRVLERIRAEYLEMPGMKLRIEQVAQQDEPPVRPMSTFGQPLIVRAYMIHGE